MILPVGAASFKEAMKMGAEVYHHLKVGYLLTSPSFLFVAFLIVECFSRNSLLMLLQFESVMMTE